MNPLGELKSALQTRLAGVESMQTRRWLCPECGESISVLARTCPVCRAPTHFNPAVEMGSVEAHVILSRWRRRAAEAAQGETAEAARTTSEDSKSKARKGKVPVRLRSWTQPDLDRAIHEYKASRSARYQELASGVRQGKPGAMKKAQQLFGRNVVARELGVKSRAMVSKSPAWREIAEELKLGKEDRRRLPTKRIGIAIAVQQSAASLADPVGEEAILNETINLLRTSLPRVAAEEAIERLRLGETTVDNAEELLREFREQQRDRRTNRTPRKP